MMQSFLHHQRYLPSPRRQAAAADLTRSAEIIILSWMESVAPKDFALLIVDKLFDWQRFSPKYTSLALL
jgi:hypothetical protein